MRTSSLLLLLLGLIAGCSRVEVDKPRTGAVTNAPALAVASPPTPARKSATDDEIARRFISRYAGTYDYDALLAEPDITRLLKELLKDEYAHLIESMSHLRQPIDVLGGRIALNGIRNDAPEEAILCITTHPLRTDVGFSSGSQMTVYSQTSKYEFLPDCILHWVYLKTHDTSTMRKPPVQGGSDFTFQYKVVR